MPKSASAKEWAWAGSKPSWTARPITPPKTKTKKATLLSADSLSSSA